MARLTPYLNFVGNAREAMDFYKHALGGELWAQTFGEAPMSEGMSPEMQGRLMHSELSDGQMALMAADGMDEHGTQATGGPITLCINGEERDVIRGYYEKLSDGGTITQPLTEEFFGMYGALTDKFGVNWMFQAGSGPQA